MESGEFHILVQSANFNPDYVVGAIDDFLYRYYEKLFGNVNIKHFNLVLYSLQENLWNETKSLREISNEFWIKIKSDDLHYDPYKASIEAIPNMSFGIYVNKFYEHIIDVKTRRMLKIVLYGKGKRSNLNVDCIISYEKINQTILDLDHACIP